LRLEHRGRHARLEEAWNAADRSERCARLVEDAARIVVVGKRPGEQAARDRSQNSRRRSMRFSGGLPAMMAALTAPIEMPATQLGMCPAMARAS
jgi:hypothetical protein